MPLSQGSKLDQFEIRSQLGSGGMGEVYLAEDTNLHRQVAIKVLPKAFESHPEAISRLEREARSLAALSHSNVGALYDFREAEGTHYLVMELVEGESLDKRLLRGPLPIEETLPIFIQVARALEAAHERGIVHRDLKPGNIMLGKEGEVKVLDFGLAKALGPSSEVSDEESDPSGQAGAQNLTAEGVIVGTPTYMSPEQARAKDVDKRTDIWALGCTMYECLAGKPPFTGKSAAELITHVLRDAPDLTALPSTTPDSVRLLIRRCLERDRRNRLKDAGDIAITLQDAMKALDSGFVAKVSAALEGPAKRETGSKAFQRLGIISSIVALVCAGLLLLVLQRGPSDAPGPVLTEAKATPAPKVVRRFSIALTPEYEIKRPTPILGDSVLTISPDGSTVVYVTETEGVSRLIARRLDELDARPIKGSEGAWCPFFSPDGQWVGFQERDDEPRLMKIPIGGGVAVPLAEINLPAGATWGGNGKIVYTEGIGSGLWRIAADGGTPEQITTPDPDAREMAHGKPQALAGGSIVLYGSVFTPPHTDHSDIHVRSFVSGTTRTIARDVGLACYVPTGHIVYPRKGVFLAVPFDLDTLTTTGREVPITEARMASNSTVPRNYAFSNDGTLVYVPVTAAGNVTRTLVWVDREGNEEPIAAPARPYRSVRISPNGKLLTFDDIDFTYVWIYDFERGATRRLTFSAASDYRPMWMPDGRRVAFLSARAEETAIYAKRADGSGSAEHLVSNPDYPFPEAITTDGRTMIYSPAATLSSSVFAATIGSDEEHRVLLDGKFLEHNVRLSPDDKWISYESTETGQFEIYVQSYPDGTAKWQVSTGGGKAAIWNPNGKELFYWGADQLMAVDIELEPSFSFGIPKPLFKMPSKISGDLYTVPYDVAPDGQRFLIIKEGGKAAWATELIVVENWFEELKRLVPSGATGPPDS